MAPNPKENQFLLAIKELDEGNLLLDLHSAMGEVVAAVQATGKGGKVTLTVKFTTAKNARNVMLLEPSIKTTLPRLEAQSTVMYANDDNELSRNDARQPRLPHTLPAEVRRFSQQDVDVEKVQEG